VTSCSKAPRWDGRWARGPRLSTWRPDRRWKSRCRRSRAAIRAATTSVGAGGGGQRASPEGAAVLASGIERASARQVTQRAPPRSSDRRTPVGPRRPRASARSGRRPEAGVARGSGGAVQAAKRGPRSGQSRQAAPPGGAKGADGGRRTDTSVSAPPTDGVSPAGERPCAGVVGCEPRGAGSGSWLLAAAAGRCPGRVVFGPRARNGTARTRPVAAPRTAWPPRWASAHGGGNEGRGGTGGSGKWPHQYGGASPRPCEGSRREQRTKVRFARRDRVQRHAR
jgi:hypothetical protein